MKILLGRIVVPTSALMITTPHIIRKGYLPFRINVSGEAAPFLTLQTLMSGSRALIFL